MSIWLKDHPASFHKKRRKEVLQRAERLRGQRNISRRLFQKAEALFRDSIRHDTTKYSLYGKRNEKQECGNHKLINIKRRKIYKQEFKEPSENREV